MIYSYYLHAQNACATDPNIHPANNPGYLRCACWGSTTNIFLLTVYLPCFWTVWLKPIPMIYTI